jgi:hypothetical protein
VSRYDEPNERERNQDGNSDEGEGMMRALLSMSTVSVLLGLVGMGCGDSEATASDGGKPEPSTSWEQCEARGFKGSCRGTV